MTFETLIMLSLAIPAIAAILITIFGKYPNLRESISIFATVFLFIVTVSLYQLVSVDTGRKLILYQPVENISISFSIEPLGILFSLVASFLWIVTSIYSIGYMRAHNESNQTRFYAFFALAISSTMGICFANNLFTLFIFYELLTITTYPLVTHSGTEEAKKSGRLYLGILLGTSIMFQLLAIIWTWHLTGTVEFTNGGVFTEQPPPLITGILYTLFIFGIGKAAIMPIHKWLPAAMVAPTPVSALLHAVAVVKAGVFSILKVTVYIFGLENLALSHANEWIMYVAGATIIIASLIALKKDNLKARLAYSTISQLSYIVLGTLLANTAGIIGAGMHIATHAFGKITLFFCAGAIMVTAHKTEISDMAGLGRKMPLTMLAFLIGSLSIIGLPPLGGMWSKWFLVLGTLEASQYFLLAILLISSLLNVAYLLPIPVRGFFSKESDAHPDIEEAPLPCLIAIGITSVGCLLLFFAPQALYEITLNIIQTK